LNRYINAPVVPRRFDGHTPWTVFAGACGWYLVLLVCCCGVLTQLSNMLTGGPSADVGDPARSAVTTIVARRDRAGCAVRVLAVWMLRHTRRMSWPQGPTKRHLSRLQPVCNQGH